MSSELFVKNSQETFKRPIFSSAQAEKMCQNGFVPRTTIKWSESLRDELLDFFVKCNYPYRTIWEIPFRDPLRSEIRRFFISLDAYLESSNPVMPEKDILYGATSRDYANTLKNIKRKSFQTTWRVDNFAFPDWWESTPHYPIKDIGDIFNYSYLIFWEEEEPDDYLSGFIPVKINNRYLAKFKRTLSEILPERNSFSRIEPIEVLKTISSSSSYNERTQKSTPHYLLKPERLFFSRNINTVKRSVIRVSPNNTRDSVLLCPQDLNTISLIDKQLMEVLSQMEDHIHLRNKNRITKRLNSFLQRNTFFIQRDLKKEGITKPRELLKAMLEVLHTEYPDIEIFGYTDFYDSFRINIDGEEVIPSRGHGLGMANTLTTLMQLTIHNMIIEELSVDIPGLDISCLCLNDDFTAGGVDEYHVDSYWDKEDEILDALSIIRVPEKSFTSRNRFVLAERYCTEFGEFQKESYQRRELLLPLTCYNITHAKQYFVSAQSYTNVEFRDAYLEEIKSYWGYEFFPDEFRYPSKVGGWINEYVEGIDMTLVMLEDLPFKEFVCRGFEASAYEPTVQERGINYDSPFMKLYGNPDIPKEYRVYVDNLSIHEITWKYGRLLKNSFREFSIYWNKFHSKRQQIFKRRFETPFSDLLLSIKKRYKNIEFYPCHSMISHYVLGNFISLNIDDIYIDPNPTLSMVSKFNSTSYDFKETFSINFTNKDEFTKKTSDLLSKETARSIKSETINNFLIGRLDEIYWPEGPFDPNEQYFNPIGIGRATALFNWGIGYPVMLPQYKDQLVDEKREVFGRFLTIDELIYVSNYKLGRNLIKTLIDYSDLNIEESVNKVLRFQEAKAFNEEVIKEEKKILDEDPYLIEMPDLLEWGIPKFWNFRNDPDSFRCSLEVREILNKLDNLVIQMTFPGLYSEQDRLYEYQKLKMSSKVFEIILSRSNFDKIGEDFFDGDSDSDNGFGLFDEG